MNDHRLGSPALQRFIAATQPYDGPSHVTPARAPALQERERDELDAQVMYGRHDDRVERAPAVRRSGFIADQVQHDAKAAWLAEEKHMSLTGQCSHQVANNMVQEWRAQHPGMVEPWRQEVAEEKRRQQFTAEPRPFQVGDWVFHRNRHTYGVIVAIDDAKRVQVQPEGKNWSIGWITKNLDLVDITVEELSREVSRLWLSRSNKNTLTAKTARELVKQHGGLSGSVTSIPEGNRRTFLPAFKQLCES